MISIISSKKDYKIKSVTIPDLRIIKSIEDTRERVLLPLLFRCLWISVQSEGIKKPLDNNWTTIGTTARYVLTSAPSLL